MSYNNTNDLYYVGGRNMGINFMPKEKSIAEKNTNKLISQRCYVCERLCYGCKVINRISEQTEILVMLYDINKNKAIYENVGYLCSRCEPFFRPIIGVIVK